MPGVFGRSCIMDSDAKINGKHTTRMISRNKSALKFMIPSAIGMDRVCEWIFGTQWHRISPKTLTRSQRFARESRGTERKKEIRVKSVRIIYLRGLCIMRWFFMHTKCIPNTRKFGEKRTSSRYIRLQHSILQFIFIHGRARAETQSTQWKHLWRVIAAPCCT